MNTLMSFTALTIVFLASLARSCPTGSANTDISSRDEIYPPNAICTEYLIPVTIESENLVFNFTHWSTNEELVSFLALATTRPSAGFPAVVSGKVTEKGTHKISASFCTPKKVTGKEKHVIVATHGIGPARDHWNARVQPEKHNFVQHAIEQGYSVFFYDRLGVGKSDRISGFKSQLSQQSAILTELVGLIRSGKYTGSRGKPTKVALMGFSFGSYITNDAIAREPKLADAVVLTGMGFDVDNINTNGLVRSFVPRIARVNDEKAFGSFDDGYLTWVGINAQLMNYYKFGSYDHEVAEYTHRTRIPFAIAEFLTILAGKLDASRFTGAALAITGESDYIVCDGFCPGIFEQPARKFYRNANFKTHLQPGASHHLFFHKNAPSTFKVITDFLDANEI